MQIIKLNATDSTNAYLKNLGASDTLGDFTVVVAKEQRRGRGQMGTKWESEAGKNLTFSVLKMFDALPVLDQFLLNICVSLGVYDALQEFQVPDLCVKWPNDILSGRSKVCGILIENMLSGNNIQASVIGIGLNVNQTEFGNLPRVSSLKLLLGRSFDLDELLQVILRCLIKYLGLLSNNDVGKLMLQYETILFRRDKPSTFKDPQGKIFMGFINGVSPEGKLVVRLEDNLLMEFGLKEIQLLY